MKFRIVPKGSSTQRNNSLPCENEVIAADDIRIVDNPTVTVLNNRTGVTTVYREEQWDTMLRDNIGCFDGGRRKNRTNRKNRKASRKNRRTNRKRTNRKGSK